MTGHQPSHTPGPFSREPTPTLPPPVIAAWQRTALVTYREDLEYFFPLHPSLEACRDRAGQGWPEAAAPHVVGVQHTHIASEL